MTSRVRLGTLVLCAQLRAPRLLAKHLATIDVLSGGRLTVGVGAGWYRPEFEEAGIPFERPGVRVEQLGETVATLVAMFADEPLVPLRPPPVQRPRPPVWVGGKGDRLLAVAATRADGWNTAWTWTPEAYRERLAVFERACERVGRDPAEPTRSLGLYALVGENEGDLHRRFQRLRESAPAGVLDRLSLEEWRTGRLVGTVEQVREQLDGWAELGVRTVIVSLGALPFSVMDPDDLDILASALN
jgi:alkanesulfonate monooxygenase SsuD/methylene tetrahydromethanopterin reductase-like flavin-dependent oxidoreductase (luciferase family)